MLTESNETTNQMPVNHGELSELQHAEYQRTLIAEFNNMRVALVGMSNLLSCF
jgi:hypothetical protein